MEQSTLGKRIKDARKKLKLTQEKLAEKANISNVYLGEIERGIKIPNDVYQNIFEYLFSSDRMTSIEFAQKIVYNSTVEFLQWRTIPYDQHYQGHHHR